METRILRLGSAGFMKQAFRWILLLAVALILIMPPAGDAQVPQTVTTSITSTTGTGDLDTTITNTGNLYNIIGGTRPGDGTGPILFHSFGNFSIGEGDIGNFLNDSGFTTTNIIGRVTGPNISNIYGTIRTTGFDLNGVPTNLFLVNPNGIVFGPHGSFDVQGSVSFSTAQYLRLSDGVDSANFYANSAYGSLELSPLFAFGFLPAAYGFLTAPDPSATITVQGSTLSVLPGQSISLVGREVVIQGGAQLSAPIGRIHLGSTASLGEFAALPGESLANATSLQSIQNNPDDPALATSFTSYGLMSLALGSSIDVSGASTVFVKGGQLVLSVNNATLNTSESTTPQDTILLSQGSSIVTSNSGADPGADVQLIASNVQLDGASIQSVTTGDGRGGDISIIDAQSVSLTNGAQIVSRTAGLGDGGNITFSLAQTVSISGFDTTGTLSGITTLLFDANTFAPLVTSGVFSTASADGNGGSIVIGAPVIAVDSAGTIATINTGDERGGDVSLTGETISFTNGGQLLSSTGFDYANFTQVGTGPGGDVTVTGTDSILLSGINLNLVSLLTGFAPSNIQSVTFSGSGNGGNITANVKTLALTDGAAILSQNFSTGIDLTDDGVVDVAGVGGNVTVQGLEGLGSAATVVTLDGAAQISAQTSFGPGQGGNISITADTLEVDQSFVTIGTSSGTGKGGDLTLNVGGLTVSGGSLVRTSDDSYGFDGDFDGVVDPTSVGSGGNLTIQGINGAPAGSVVLSGSSLVGTEARDGAGGSLSIKTSVLSLNERSSIYTSTIGVGHGGNIDLRVQEATLVNAATIVSRTSVFDPNQGVGGTITLQGLDGNETKADSLTLSGFFSGIISDSSGLADPGDIEVYATTVSLTDQAVISGGLPLSSGTGGEVFIHSDLVSITGGSQISSQAFAQNAGTVTIMANQLTMDNGSIVTTSASPVFGSGGDVVVHVENMSLANGSTINSSTSATGRAGDIIIAVDQSVNMDSGSRIIANTTGQGDAGNVLVNAGAVTVTNGSEISTSAQPPEEFFGQPSDLIGNAGDIVIAATGSSLLVSNGGTIASVSETGGKAGTIRILTPSLTLDNGIITTSASSTGNAGSITADVGTLTLTNDAEISSSSIGTILNAGDAGNITTYASGSFTSNGSKVSTSAENAKGGDILIDAQNAQLSNGTLISANSNAPFSPGGEGNAGNITITSASNVVIQNSSVTTEASAASGGSIEINASDTGMIQLINSTVSTSVGGVAGSNGGNISIDPQFVVLQNSQIIAQAFAGAGGAINIIATSAFIADPASIVDASSTLGISGNVNIQSPLQNIGGELAALSEEFSSAAALLAQQCAARVADGKFSTFVIAAREGLPAEPGGFLASPSLTAELLGSRLSGRDSHTQLPAVTGLFPKYDARPIQLAKLGGACR